MRLVITTPTALVADEANVRSVRAEDETGGFGLLERHADFLTALTVSIVSWRREDGRERFCAVRQGVLSMFGGREVSIATREAVIGDDVNELEAVVLHRFREAEDAERTARVESFQLQMKAIRSIIRHLRPGEYGGGGYG